MEAAFYIYNLLQSDPPCPLLERKFPDMRFILHSFKPIKVFLKIKTFALKVGKPL